MQFYKTHKRNEIFRKDNNSQKLLAEILAMIKEENVWTANNETLESVKHSIQDREKMKRGNFSTDKLSETRKNCANCIGKLK